MFLDYLPAVVFFAVAAIIGIVGNCVAVKFYSLKLQPNTPFTFLVKALAVTDCVVCVNLISGATEVAFNIDFNFRYLCKISKFLNKWTIYTSIWILAEITIDRYMKICQPFKQQMTVRLAKLSIPVTVITTLIMSVRTLVIYDVVSINITTSSTNGSSYMVGYYCATTHDPTFITYVAVFYWSDIVIGACTFVMFISIYGLITYTLIKRRNIKTSWQSKKSSIKQKCSAASEISTEITRPSIKQKCSAASEISTEITRPSIKQKCSAASEISSEITSTGIPTDVPSTNVDNERSGRPTTGNNTITTRKMKRSEYKITIMMLWISLVFLLSLTSFFVASLLFRKNVDSVQSVKPLTLFMLRCISLNSVSNPLIYYIYNEKFRKVANKFLTCRYKGGM